MYVYMSAIQSSLLQLQNRLVHLQTHSIMDFIVGESYVVLVDRVPSKWLV